MRRKQHIPAVGMGVAAAADIAAAGMIETEAAVAVVGAPVPVQTKNLTGAFVERKQPLVAAAETDIRRNFH